MRPIAGLLLHASFGNSPGERFVDRGRQASTRDLVNTLRAAGLERLILFSASPELTSALRGAGIRCVASDRVPDFHFGRTLQSVIRDEHLDGMVYFGSGSGPLLTGDQARTLVRFAGRDEPGALFNNFYSCDFCAVAGAQRLLDLHLPSIDNPLGFSLSDQGFPCFNLPRDLATQVDIDTPIDLCLLAADRRGGPALRAFLDEERPIYPPLAELIELLTDRSARLAVFGRVHPATWGHLEDAVACRTIVYSEGRGMRASPQKRPLFLQEIRDRFGVERFLASLASCADGALLDTRPLLARGRTLPPAADRFACDLFDAEAVHDPLWAAFTRAVQESDLPVLLGGHSLVSGGLYLLAELAWKERDLRRRLRPETIDWEKERP
jgi:hypothetical protein